MKKHEVDRRHEISLGLRSILNQFGLRTRKSMFKILIVQGEGVNKREVGISN